MHRRSFVFHHFTIHPDIFGFHRFSSSLLKIKVN
jgi:hypothetical protein